MRTDRGDEANSHLSSRADFLDIWENQPPVTLRACVDLYTNYLTDAIFNFANAPKNGNF